MSLLDTFLEEGLNNPPLFVSTDSPRREIHIGNRTDGAKGSGTPDDPYNGSTRALLDDLLSLTLNKQNLTIRFGPGTFQTAGFADPSVTTALWFLQSGTRFIGSGMYQTVLQLVDVRPFDPSTGYGNAAIIGRASGVNLWNIEISDLTLDMNLHRLPLDSAGNPALLKAGALGFEADKVRISRVRMINWGSHAIVGSPGGHSESFPIFIDNKGQRPADAYGEGVLENCVIEQPDLSPARESTLSNFKTISTLSVATTRNCRFSGDYTTGSPPPAIEVIGLTYSDPLLTLVLKWPHGMQGGNDANAFKRDEVLITGSPNSNLNKRHLLTISPPDFRRLELNIAGLTGNLFAAGMLAQRYVPEEMLVSLSYAGAIITATTLIPHGRKRGDYVRISGAVTADLANPFIGSFRVGAVLSETSFQYETDTVPTAPATGEIWLDRWPSKAVHISGFEDIGDYESALITGEPEGWPIDLQAEFWDTSRDQVTLITVEPHFKAPGDWIQVDDIVNTNPVWNGWRKVVDVISRTKVRISIGAVIQNNPFPSFAFADIKNKFQGHSTVGTGWGPLSRNNLIQGCVQGGPYHDSNNAQDQITWDNYYFEVFNGLSDTNYTKGHFVERNIIELQTHVKGRTDIHPSGISTGEYNLPSPVHENVFVRFNIVRFTNNNETSVPAANWYQSGVLLDDSIKILVHNNIVNLPGSLIPIRFRDCTLQDGVTFNNLEMNGNLVHGLISRQSDNAILGKQQELQDYADDLFLFWKK